jgi:hypothetical protein
MYITKEKFHDKLYRVQKYLTGSKFFKNSNKSGEKQNFIRTYGIDSWLKLKEQDRKSHQLVDCTKCNETETGIHKSASEETHKMEDLSVAITNTIMPDKNTSPAATNKNVEKFINILSPVLKNTLDVNFSECVSKVFNLTKKQSSTEKQKETLKERKQNNHMMQNVLFDEESEVQDFLSSGMSYSQYERERKKKYFETPESARKSFEHKIKKINSGFKKPKKHHGKLENYHFDKESFLHEIKENKSENVNWSSMAKQYDVRNKNGNHPPNAGQILKVFAKSHGIDVDKFNNHKIISGRDVSHRIRRKYLRVRGLTVPRQKPAAKIRTHLRQKIDQGDIDVGVCIAPKVHEKNKIDSSGDLITEKEEVYGRKFSLRSIRERSLHEQAAEGVLRSLSDDDYNQLSSEEVKKKLTEYGKYFLNILIIKPLNRQTHERTENANVCQMKINTFEVK